MTDETFYTELLQEAIGHAAAQALRALDAGGDPRAVWLAYQEMTLPPVLAEAMRLARESGTITSASLRVLHPHASAPTLSNRMTELERTGLLVQVRQEAVKGGGRRLVYAPWDRTDGQDGLGATET